jgi:hypothetical protein
LFSWILKSISPPPISGHDTKEWREMSVHNNNMVTIYPYTDLWK